MARNKSEYVIAIKRIREINPCGQLIPEADRPWCYLASDNGPMGSGELVFSESDCYRKDFDSVQSSYKYWESNNHAIRENWDFFDMRTISVREFTTEHAKVLSF